MPQPRGRRCAAEPKLCQRLDRPIFADGLRETLDQLLMGGLHSLNLALRLPAVRRIHRSLLTRPYITHLYNLQDHTMTLDNHYTTLRSITPIMDLVHARLALMLTSDLDFYSREDPALVGREACCQQDDEK